MYNFFILASLYSLAGLIEPYQIEKPKGRYSRFDAHFIPSKNVKAGHCRPDNETPFKYCSLGGGGGSLVTRGCMMAIWSFGSVVSKQNTAPVLLGVKYFTL